MKKLIIVLFLTLKAYGSDTQHVPLKPVVKELGMTDIKSYSLRAPDDSLICSLVTSPGGTFNIFDSPAFQQIDTSTLPPSVLHLITAVKAIKEKFDLNQIVIIGDLYVQPIHRGKGHAGHLLQETCTHLLNSDNTKTVVLIPDPFEYENGAQITLDDNDKKLKLMKLYQRCGFKNSEEKIPSFMYLNRANS